MHGRITTFWRWIWWVVASWLKDHDRFQWVRKGIQWGRICRNIQRPVLGEISQQSEKSSAGFSKRQEDHRRLPLFWLIFGGNLFRHIPGPSDFWNHRCGRSTHHYLPIPPPTDSPVSTGFRWSFAEECWPDPETVRTANEIKLYQPDQKQVLDHFFPKDGKRLPLHQHVWEAEKPSQGPEADHLWIQGSLIHWGALKLEIRAL